MVYFMISTTLNAPTKEQTWENIKAIVFKGGFMSGESAQGYMIDPRISDFKLGNVDQLMMLNDQMIKLDNVVEGLLKKIERQLYDIVEDPSKIQFKIEAKDGNYIIEKYIQNFQWDDKKFSNKAPLQEVLKSLTNRVNLIESEIRQKTQLFQESKSQANQLAKKEGNLYVKDLTDILTPNLVKPGDFVQNGSLTTVVAVVAKNQTELFRREYESLTEFVVPGSLKNFNYEDREGLSLWRVIIFTKPMGKIEPEADLPEGQQKKQKKRGPVEEFVYQAREKLKVTVREFVYNPDEYKDREENRKKFEAQSQSYTGILKTACERGFGEIYQVYIHQKRLKLIVDIAMRFGANEKMCSFIIKPAPGKEKKIQQDLLKMFSDPNQKGLYGTKEELDDTEDFYPFIYVPINIH